MNINTLTPAEEQLMQLMWKLQTAYLKDLMASYPEPKPHQNTVSTFVKILVEKKFLRIEKEGRIFKYYVAIPFDEYRLFLVHKLLRDYYEDSAEQLVATLREQKLLESPATTELAQPQGLPVHKTEKKKKQDIRDFVKELTTPTKAKKKDKKKKKKDKS
ncbi:transcriptional regulator [Chryseobacterium sp. 6424]|uniref:BlaI/MecI/CopY family transcriptional regulator n=1 Tax=Chryseobacterium sp. 6424 TaxID=2039166 RepID=UPI000EFD56F8|nr:BlaI/MecI/CopY family transcriptional regulator [Chryseobacterium sp. 6424]AYO57573.1 transcriptional regulator [Chryseobacterium sp. 6424]